MHKATATDWWDGARYGGYLAVPLNNEGNRALLQEIPDEGDVLWVAISPDEYALLMPLFQQFNQAFMLSIGSSTGEVLFLKDVVDALELACAFRDAAEAPEVRDAAAKVVLAVQTMMECGAYLEFDL